MVVQATVLTGVEMGLGCWQWGDKLMWGYGKDYAGADVKAAFDASLAAGVTFFDTAEAYGNGRSEQLLGQFRRESQAPLRIATKFMPLPWRLHRDTLLNALRASLKRLGLPSIALYQMHWPFPPVSIETWMSAMTQAVEESLAEAVGVSNYNLDQTKRAANALAKRDIPLTSNQVEYNLLQRRAERSGLLDYCRDNGITLIAYSPLAKGLLTGKYTPENPPPGVRGGVSRAYLARIQPLIARLRTIGEAHGGKLPAQVALNWTMCKGALPIPGAKSAKQMQMNAGALGWRLTDDEVAALDEASERV
jgi:aryl-alcohol dehydrogenase-like predicted oxidoreductase